MDSQNYGEEKKLKTLRVDTTKQLNIYNIEIWWI
jgi:hypothetical protein